MKKSPNEVFLIDIGKNSYLVDFWFNLKSWGVSVTNCHGLFEIQFLCFFLMIFKYKKAPAEDWEKSLRKIK